MKFGICASFREVALLNTRPFDFLEENIQRFLVPEQPQAVFDDLLREARRLSLSPEVANTFFPSDLFLIDTATRRRDAPRLERYVKTTLQRAEQAGIQVLVFGSGLARACPEGYDPQAALRQLGDALATWCDWARGYGVTIALEPLRYEETNMLNTVEECGTFLSGLSGRGAQLIVDLYHMACNREAPESMLPWTSLLSHVHVAQQAGRAAPTADGEDFRSAFAVLKRAGYDRRISIECHWRDLACEVDSALSVLREQWQSSTMGSSE
jgi:sugar phosphate isomerase/epimerase